MDAPDPPDYSQQINTQNQITSRQMDLAEQQYADQKALVDKYLPLFDQQAQLSLSEQAKTGQRADQQWANYTTNFMPLEQKFAQQAADYNTVGRQEQDAQRAQAEVASQFDQQRTQQAEDMAAAGLMPGSGRALTLSNATGIEQAKAEAAAGNTARRATEATGLSLMNSAIGVGRGQVAGGLQAADLALRQGGSAQGSAGGAVSMAGVPASTSSSIYGGATSSNNAATGIISADYNNRLNASNSSNALFGDILGAGMGAAGMFFSSEETKDMGPEVDGASDAVEASPAKEWRYKPGLGDGLTKARMGPTAESLRDATGGVVSDGEKVDGIAMVGLHHAAIGEQAKQIKALTKQVAGLASAIKRGAANDGRARKEA